MLAPKSYTSEDVIELHCHGGGVCVHRVLGCCLKAGARLANPGEFTLRAFLNGRLDLSQVCCPFALTQDQHWYNMFNLIGKTGCSWLSLCYFCYLLEMNGRPLYNTSRT